MRTYRIYVHPNRPVPIVVKVGFSWLALVFAPLWFLLNKMWLMFMIVTAFMVSASVFFEYFQPSTEREEWLGVGMYLLALVGLVLIGKFAHPLRCSALENRGYVLQATVKAKNVRVAREEFSKMSRSDETPGA